MDLGLDLDNTIAVVTGGGGQIGQIVVKAFLSAGCRVAAFDINTSKFEFEDENLLRVKVDVSDEEAMRHAWIRVKDHFAGVPTVCVCAAGLDLSFIEHHRSIVDMPVEQFRRTLDVNTTGTFITAKMWLTHIEHMADTKNVSLIIIGSEAGVLGVPGNSDYSSSKAAIQYGLMLSLAPEARAATDARNPARVNAIAPGTVDTPQFRKECAEAPTAIWQESEATVASRKAVKMEDVARTCLMLASDRWSASINGQVIRVDGGKSGRMFWTKDGEPTW